MKVKICIAVLCMMLIFSEHGFFAMESDNYKITTSVMSGGGAPMTSDNFSNNSTLGQPSPFMDPDSPPGSEHFYLDPGFWYTLAPGYVPGCIWDLDQADGDVDGSDLADFAAGAFDSADLAEFAAEFGRTDCLQ